MAKEMNIDYALYDKDDNYIVGFSTMGEMSEFLGNTKPQLSKTLSDSRVRAKRGAINRVLNEEGNYDCSQRLYTYKNKVVDRYGHDWGQKCSVYKFWEEK